MTVQKKLVELGKELFQIRDRKDELEAQLKEINKRKEELEKRLLPEIMIENEIQNFKIDGYGTVFKKNDVQAYIRVDDNDAAITWLKENGHGDIVKETVHWATLRKWANEMLDENQEMPDTIQVNPITVAQTRRS